MTILDKIIAHKRKEVAERKHYRFGETDMPTKRSLERREPRGRGKNFQKHSRKQSHLRPKGCRDRECGNGDFVYEVRGKFVGLMEEARESLVSGWALECLKKLVN